MPPKAVGRPRKSDTEGTPQQIKRREYQRKYQSQIKAGIEALEQDEIDCLEELDRIRKEKSRLIDEIAKANEQANMILQEKVARPAGGVKKKVAPPKPTIPASCIFLIISAPSVEISLSRSSERSISSIHSSPATSIKMPCFG